MISSTDDLDFGDQTRKRKPQTCAPESSPWYLFATLYGEPHLVKPDTHEQTRLFWNRYMASRLDVAQRDEIIASDRFDASELEPLTSPELQIINEALSRRSNGEFELSALDQEEADFAHIVFEREFDASRFLFPNSVDFSHCEFRGGCRFSEATFFGVASFFDSIFFERANFDRAHFEFAGFTRAKFPLVEYEPSKGVATIRGLASFSYAQFKEQISFDDSRFGLILFMHTSFLGGASFCKSTFFEAHFLASTFGGPGIFDDAVFIGGTTFDGAIFSDRAFFENSSFRGESSFINSELKAITSFKGAAFSLVPPAFFGAKLHEGTVWRGARWPLPSSTTSDPGRFVDAYERLKLEMDRLRKHEDELDFFALELQSRRASATWWKGFPTDLYGWLCNYGRSYSRPVFALFVLVIAGALLASAHLGYGREMQAFSLSLANTLGVFGFRRDFFAATALEMPGWLSFVAGFQTLCGAALLFLFAVALRNRFRMK